MKEAFVVIENVIMLSVLVFLGYLMVKTKYITKPVSNGLATIISRITLPLLIAKIILSPSMSIEKIKGSLPLYFLSIGFVLLTWALSYFIAKLVKSPADEFPAFVYFMAMTNVIFMGLPVCKAIFGEESAFYVSVITIGQDTILWTIGVILLSKFKIGEAKSKIKINPISIAFFLSVILKLLGVQIPPLFFAPMEFIGNATPYLAMIYLGMLLSLKSILVVVKKWRTYIYIAMKLILYPLLAGFIIYKLFGNHFGAMQKGVFVVEFATSSVVALLPVFKEYELNPEYASGLVFLSTIICLFTLPVVLLLSNILFI